MIKRVPAPQEERGGFFLLVGDRNALVGDRNDLGGAIHVQLLSMNVQWFPGGCVDEAHRLSHDLTLGVRGQTT